MKTTTLALLICLTAFTVEASIIQSLLNHTSLRGSVKYNTTNGLDIGYNASLGFKSELMNIELANLMSRFVANNTNNSEYNYSGVVAVNHNGHNANATVKGVADLDVQINNSKPNDASNNSKTMIMKQFMNKNTWKIQADQASATGKHNATVNVSMFINQNGSRISVRENIQGIGYFDGKASYNRSNVGKFIYVRGGQLAVDQEMNINPNQSKRGPNPANATYMGRAKFMDLSALKFNNNTSATFKNGKAVFQGASWVNGSRSRNGTASRVVNAQYGGWVYQAEDFKNAKKIDVTVADGRADYAQAINAVMFKNGTNDVALANYGDAQERWITMPSAKPSRASRNTGITLFDEIISHHHEEEEGGEHPHPGPCPPQPIRGMLNGTWKHGLHYRTQLNKKTKALKVDAESGAFYDAQGVNTLDEKPWVMHGNHTANAHWKINKNNRVDDIIVNPDTNSALLNNLNQKVDELRSFVHYNQKDQKH